MKNYRKLAMIFLVSGIVFLLCGVLTSCTPNEQCGIVRGKKIIYGQEYGNKDMPIGYSITTEYGTYQVSKTEYESVAMSSTYCK